MKKGTLFIVGLLLVGVIVATGFIIVRTGASAVATDAFAAQAQQELQTALPPTLTPALLWEGEQVSAGFVMELVKEINASHMQDMAAVVHVSDTGIKTVKEVGEVGLVTGAVQGASPWCAIGTAAIVVFTLLFVVSKSRGEGK